MHSRLLSMAARLSDSELLRRVVLLAGQEREVTVELIGHLAELDARKLLHVAQGYGSLFTYCTGALQLAEHAAYNRIEAARLSRRFPAVLDLLADGSLNLSTARLLAPHLRPDNFEMLVAQARGRSKRDVEVLVARLSPRPDVAASVRRLPARAQTVQGAAPSGPLASVIAIEHDHGSGTGLAVEPEDDGDLPTPSARDPRGSSSPDVAALDSRGLSPSEIPVAAPERPTHRPAITPLAPERYRVQFTIGAATHEKLRRAQEFLRREIPDGDPGAIFDRALTLLLEEVTRKKLAAAEKPRQARGMRTRSRHIPARVRRAVWQRDGGRCAFVAAHGRRCTERVFLEFHHREPYAFGGEATVANVSLRCRSHNVYEAQLAFGHGAPVSAMSNSPRGELSRGTPPDRAQTHLNP
jgi:5-methylcytosine-specific restriction endonuclease McrA